MANDEQWFQREQAEAEPVADNRLPGLDHIANFINALDTEGMTALEVRKAIYKECIQPTTAPVADRLAALQAHADALAGALKAMFEATPEHDEFCPVGPIYKCTCDLNPANDQTRQALRAYEAFKSNQKEPNP